MRIHACAAAVASAATLAFTPLAAAHGTWWRADAEHGQSFNQMQSASTEAPAFHTGDGSIYDSSRGLEPSTPIAASPRLVSPGTYERQSMSVPSTMENGHSPRIDEAARLDDDPADQVSSGSVLPGRPGLTGDSRPGATTDSRPGATVDRYGAPLK